MEPELKLTIQFDSLSFLMNNSNCREEPKREEGDVTRREEVKEEEAGSENSSTYSVNSGSGLE
jgi:hypothetical protein